MSSDQDKRQKLLSDLFFRRISEEQFLREFGANRENIHGFIRDMLKRGLEEKNPDTIEEAIPLVYRFGITQEYLDILNILALEPWHREHEDVVFALGRIKDPSSINVLGQTAVAKHPYLAVDEFHALGTKSMHALRNIETPEAVARIGELGRTENEILRTTARALLKDLVAAGTGTEAEAEAKIQLASIE